MQTSGIQEKQVPRDSYHQLTDYLQQHFDRVAYLTMFTTNVPTSGPDSLFEVFLRNLPEQERQHHRCHTCRNFVSRYGSIVNVLPDGSVDSVLWGPDAPEPYRRAFRLMQLLVEQASIKGVARFSDQIWGTPTTGVWTHMAVHVPVGLRHPHGLMTAYQYRAQKKEDYILLCKALAQYPLALARQAYELLSSSTMYRGEKCVEAAKWFLELHRELQERSAEMKNRLIWRTVVMSPPGFCHVHSTMLGTVLDDLNSGISIRDVTAKFNAKMDPLQYQRPSVPPNDQNIAQAEKVISELKASKSLSRRFARLEDIRPIWTPSKTPEVQQKGVFDHLKKTSRPVLDVLAPVKITWEKFASTVLPTAQRIELEVPERGRYIALVTAQYPEAPPILQWDHEAKRNPVNWYVYHTGSRSRDWNLTPRTVVPVTAITYLPHQWDDPERYRHQGRGAVLVLEGCRDLLKGGGLALFPEVLKGEFHGIRSTIEAYSRAGELEGRDEASACGLDLRDRNLEEVTLRVISMDGQMAHQYLVDRWD